MKVPQYLPLQNGAIRVELSATARCSKGGNQHIGSADVERVELRTSVPGLDILCMALGVLVIFLIGYVLGDHHPMWEDEMLGWKLLTDPSWHHMVYAWKAGADGGGFLFYLSGRWWFRLFGPSAMSFRFYSDACFAGAFLLLWVALRRFYSTGIVAFALFNTWFFNGPMIVHMGEGRFYGLLMLGTAAVCWIVVKADETPGQPAYLCALMFLCHSVVTLSHLLGIVYSANLLGVLIVLDMMKQKRPRVWLYLSGACAWLLLIPERVAIRSSMQVGNPHFWTTQPSLAGIVDCYCAFSKEIGAVLVVLGICAIVCLRGRPAGWASSVRQAWQERCPVHLICAALLLVPMDFLVVGLLGTSLFVTRYLMPVTSAQIILTAEAAHLINWPKIVPSFVRRSTALRVAAAVCFITVILLLNLVLRSKDVMVPKDYTGALTASLPKGMPVVCEEAWLFTELMGRDSDSGVQYTYLLDWPYAASDGAPRLEVTEYHLMENWKKVGYFPNSIRYRTPFLQQNPRFIVLHTLPVALKDGKRVIGNPLLDRFRTNAGYQVLPYRMANATGGIRAWLICRHSCDLGAPARPSPV